MEGSSHSHWRILCFRFHCLSLEVLEIVDESVAKKSDQARARDELRFALFAQNEESVSEGLQDKK